MNEPEFLALVDRNRARLIRLCRFYGGTQEEREDLFQEIVYQGWRSLPRFRGEAQPDTWLYRIAINSALTHRRRADKRPKADSDGINQRPPAIHPDWAEDLDTQARLAWLYESIHGLTEPDKTLLLLYLEEMSYAEMAELTGMNVNLIGVRLNRAKKKLSQLAQQTFSA